MDLVDRAAHQVLPRDGERQRPPPLEPLLRRREHRLCPRVPEKLRAERPQLFGDPVDERHAWQRAPLAVERLDESGVRSF